MATESVRIKVARDRWRLGIDIGGTFTDIVFLGSTGETRILKVPSTPRDFSAGIVTGLREAFAGAGLKPADIALVLHATTVATNAILELKGARTALITTMGFRDVLEIRRLRMPRLYDIAWQKPPMLVERDRRHEVTERIDVRGSVVTPLDEEECMRVLDRIRQQQVDALAICLINGYMNPVHEAQIAELAAKHLPGVHLSVAHQILREVGEYERTSTTVVDAYVKPVVGRYVRQIEEQLTGLDIHVPLLIMQSNGNLMTAASLQTQPVRCIESGPAAGVIAGEIVSRATGIKNLITFDMGGTTAKASIVENGEIQISAEYEVGGGLNAGSGLIKGSGYALRIPSIDLAEVGAGGGSIARIDRGGALQVGPESAGAEPGPVCYDLGGEEPTITDANVVLGYLNPHRLAGGRLRVVPSMSAQAVNDKIARPLGLGLLEAAYGIFVLANAKMARAVQAVSTERGRDCRDYALLAFGGNGAVHGPALAQALGIKKVIVPPHPGVFSAFGLLRADVGHQSVRTFVMPLIAGSLTTLNQALAEVEAEAASHLQVQDYSRDQIAVTVQLDLRYTGQSHFLTVPFQGTRLSADTIPAVLAAFAAEHQRTYGHRGSERETVEVVNLRLAARGIDEVEPTGTRAAEAASGDLATAPGHRQAYFGAEHGMVEAMVIERSHLAAAGSLPGPLIIEEYDATIVVPPGAVAQLDPLGNVIIDLQTADTTHTRAKVVNHGQES